VPRSATFARSRWSPNRYRAVDLRCRPVRADCHLGAQSVFATAPERRFSYAGLDRASAPFGPPPPRHIAESVLFALVGPSVALCASSRRW
jgi:hypothetical protein